MVVRNEGQALCVAVEMERRAIRVYERALMLAQDEEVRRGIMEILSDERKHLARFEEMRRGREVPEDEEAQLIAAMGAEVILQGGVMELSRAQALTTLRGLYTYARDSEAEAVRTYAGFAEKCGDSQVAEAFMAIVREESRHLVELGQRLNRMDA